MSDYFLSLPWHDAAILNISLDRSNPGKNDVVSFEIRWPDHTFSKVYFLECYGFYANMNFGIIAEESILSVDIDSEDAHLLDIKSRWSALGVSLPELSCYSINTASTGSIIKIVAGNLRADIMGG